MMHDPMQAYYMLGAYPGVTPFGLPYGTVQTPGINPAIGHPWTQAIGISPAFSGQHPAQLALTGGWQNPLTQGIQNPLVYAAFENPLVQHALLQNSLLQNPLLQNPLEHPFIHPIQAQLQAHAQQLALQAYAAQAGGIAPYGGVSPYPQMVSPFTQPGLTSGPGTSPLAPQTWVGQGGGIGYGQGPSTQPPLAQVFGRGFQSPGISPWAGF